MLWRWWESKEKAGIIEKYFGPGIAKVNKEAQGMKNE